jgi:hypothetical protein
LRLVDCMAAIDEVTNTLGQLLRAA